MSHTLLLRTQIAFVIRIGSGLDRHILHDCQPIAFQSHTLSRIVGQQTNLRNTQLPQNLCTYAVVAQVGVESEVDIGIDRVVALLLYPSPVPAIPNLPKPQTQEDPRSL